MNYITYYACIFIPTYFFSRYILQKTAMNHFGITNTFCFSMNPLSQIPQLSMKRKKVKKMWYSVLWIRRKMIMYMLKTDLNLLRLQIY